MSSETTTTTRLSVIAVALNEARHVGSLVTSVRALCRPASVQLETILVDGGSEDGTAEAALSSGFDKVVTLPGASIPVCRNRGVAEATGDWIAFFDADCQPGPGWLEAAAPLLRAMPRAILAWPAMPPEPRTWLQDAWLFHWMHKNRRYEEIDGTRVIREEGFRLATTRNMVFHRSVFADLGGFNEALTTGEDTDFAFRAYMSGIPVLGIPALVVAHWGEPRTLREFYRQQLWHANRKAYTEIVKASGGKVGGNAPRFTLLFLIAAIVAMAGIVLALAMRTPWALLGIAPIVGLVTGPAALLCRRAGNWRHFAALSVIYFAYGLARAIDLAGLNPVKRSWKAAR